MKKKLFLSVIASVCCALTAAADFSGSWEGTWYSDYDGTTSGWMAADVSQEGTSLIGWLDFETAYDGNFSMQITGTVSGETADMAGSIIVEGSTYRIEYTQASLSPSGTTLSGNYTITCISPEYGSFTWDWGTFEMQKPARTVNDLFSDAIVLTGASGQVSGSNVGATKEAGEPDHNEITGGASVWWSWVAPSSGRIVIDTFGSDFDTVLAVYTGDAVGSLTEIKSNDDFWEGLQSRVAFDVIAGTTYRIAVDGYEYGESGNIILNWNPGVLSSYAGTYSGTYSGDETGTWQVVVDEFGDIIGYIIDELGDRYDASGAVQANGIAGFVSLGADFSGQIDSSGYLSGTWDNLYYGLNGIFSGQRESNSLTVTFDGQSGTAPIPASTIVTNGATYGPLPTTTRTGFTFGGWWTGTSGTGTEVTSTTTVTITTAQTLYAKWTLNAISTGDDFNDNAKDTAKWGTDDSFGSSATLLEANGHLQFGGNGEAGIVRPWIYSYGSYTSNWEVSADVHVGALSLQQNNYIEMFLAVAPPDRVLKDDNFTVSLELGKDSYGSWREYGSQMTTNGSDVGEWVGAATMDLQGRVSIRFDATTKNLISYYNGIPLRTNAVPSSWGMTGSSTFRIGLCGSLGSTEDGELPFGGMSYSGTDVYADNFALTGAGTEVLTVTFDEQGGTVPSPASTKIVTNGLTYGTLAITTRSGYTFAGWYTATNGGGTQVTSGTTVTITSAQTLYAKWTVIKESGLEYFSAFFNNGDPAEMQGAFTYYQEVMATNPQDYTSRVYAAFAKVSNLINDSELNALMGQFGFTYEDLGGDIGWDITGEFNIAGAPPSNQAVDTIWTRCQPAIDEAYTLLNAIPASWTGMAEISTNYFPVDETVYVDYPDVVSAKALLMAIRSFMNTVRAYDMTVDYAKLDWPVTLPVKAITNSSDWTNIPAQLVGEEGDALRKVKACRSGNTVYVQIEKEVLQQRTNEQVEAAIKIKLIDGTRQNLDIWYGTKYNNGSGTIGAWFQTGNMAQPVLGTSVLTTDYLEMAFPVPPEVGTLMAAGNIEWVWYGWWVGSRYYDCELESPKNHPANDLLALVPDVMKAVRNAAALPLAKADLSSAINLGQDAGARIKNRTGSELHFFEYDPVYQVEYDEAMNKLAQAQSSLAAPTSIVLDNNAVNLYLGAFYAAPFVTRDMLPAYGIDALLNDPIQGTFPDPTFGGVAPNLTRSNFAEWITGDKNLVLQANGGVLESFTSQYDTSTHAAAKLTDGAVGSDAHNWVSAVIPAPGPQTFEYSFSGGQSANLTSLTLVNATQAYNAKGFELWISADGSNAWTKVAEGTLADNAQPQAFELSGQTAKRARLVITNGYSTVGWELAEFELYGYYVEPVPSYTVTFDAQSGTTPSPTSKSVMSNMTYGTLATTTRAGYTFAGWYTATNGGGTQVTSGTPVTITSAQTLYAKWTVNAISTVTFDGQSGTAPIPASTTVTNGLTYGTLATTTRSGYTFAGWYTNALGTGAQVTSGTTVTITSAQTLYAKWTVVPVLTVTFDAQGGTASSPSTTTVTNGLTYGTLATTTRAGYTFAGWYTNALGTGAQVTSGTTVTITSAQTLYAKWTVNAISTVTFDGQGGATPSPTSTIVTNGLTYGTLATTTRAGYTFAGWYTATNGGGTEVTSGTPVTITSAQTLYAKWTVNAISTVTFDGQSGTAPIPASTTVTNGLTYGALATTTRSGYTFAGWYTATNGGGTQVTSGTTVTITSAQTLYAKWSIDVKNLVLQTNGGVLESFTSQYDASTHAAAKLTDGAVGSDAHNWVSAVIPAPGPQTFEYSFSGGQSANLTSLTLVNATQAYNAKGFELWISADGSNAWTKVAEGTLANNAQPQAFELSGQTAKRARLVITNGYSTVGWELAEFELYGYYVEPVPSYTVTFDAQSGTTPSPTSKSVMSNMTYGTLATTTRAGYTFAGWYTATNGGGTQVTSGTPVTITSAQTLYAKWTVNAISTVTFDGQSGTAPSPSTTTVTNGLTYGTLATTARAGYTFAGWYTNALGTGAQVTSGTAVTITSAQTLYAKWSINVKNLVLQTNGGVLESFTSQYNNDYAATKLTDGAVGTGTHNWGSDFNPGPQTFEYSFSGGQSANLTSLTLVNATRAYNAKGFELWISADGSNAWTKVAEGTLADNAQPQAFELSGQTAKRARLVITSGYSTAGWELAEFELYGYYYTIDGDGNGMPDWWEQQHFGGTGVNPNAVCSNGVNTMIQAYVAGLNPTDSSARFGITNHSRNLIQWNAVSGRVYNVYWTTNLMNGFQTLQTNYTGGAITDSTHSAADKCFYKIDVRLP